MLALPLVRRGWCTNWFCPNNCARLDREREIAKYPALARRSESERVVALVALTVIENADFMRGCESGEHGISRERRAMMASKRLRRMGLGDGGEELGGKS